ncbi:MAG: hypothetical protein ACFB3T_10505 [Geminicoccaceae bacterium]
MGEKVNDPLVTLRQLAEHIDLVAVSLDGTACATVYPNTLRRLTKRLRAELARLEQAEAAGAELPADDIIAMFTLPAGGAAECRAEPQKTRRFA